MSRRIRGTLLAGAVLAALATSGSAWASFAPKLLVKSAGNATNGAVTVSASVGQNDDPTAKTQIYLPNGYSITTTAPAGTKLGDVTGTASAADLNGAVLNLQGELDVIPPNATLQAQCAVTNVVATWDLHLQAATSTLDIPMYVSKTVGPEATAGGYKLVVCLPPPDVPVGTPGRAVFGAKLLSAVFTSSAIVPPASGSEPLRWTSLWTPYTPTKGTPNAAGSVEAQAIVGSPVAVQLTGVTRKRLVKTTTVKVHGKKVRRHTISTSVTFRTSVTQNNEAVPGAKVTAKAAARALKPATTSAAGLASGAFVFSKGTVKLAVTSAVADRDLGSSGCVASDVFGVPCVDATISGGTSTDSTTVVAFKK